MSRNSKNARNKARAKVITSMHAKGEKGPSSTAPAHAKKWTYRSNPDAMKKLAEFLKGPEDTKGEKTAAKKILRGAGRASA
jgi:hypothetical protein